MRPEEPRFGVDRSTSGTSSSASRWLVTPLGPWVNFASGITNYSWVRFSVWDFLGEALCAALYIFLGLAFSDRVQAVADVLGNLTWAAVGVVIAAFLGWKLFSRQRQPMGLVQEVTAPPIRK